jgi:uncharacterized Zn-finger protein
VHVSGRNGKTSESAHQPKDLENIMSEVSQMLPSVELGSEDMPAYCPNPAMPLWSSHPRVYLEMNAQGEAKCPYCGTQYKLKPGATAHGH